MEVGRPAKKRLLYNPELKKRFLKTYTNEETRNRYEQRFSATYLYESKLDKDLYEFSLNEIKDMFAAFNLSSLDTLRTDRSVFKNYVDFCIKEHIQINNKLLIVNPFDSLSNDILDKLVSKLRREEKNIKNYEEYYDILDSCINAQDAVCFIFCFHGIKAKYIPYIKEENYDFKTKTLNFMEKVYSFSKKEASLIERAVNETTYYAVKYYGERWEEQEKKQEELKDKRKKDRKSRAVLTLSASPYIIKGCYINEEALRQKEPVKAQVVSLRIKRTSQYILEKPMLNSQTVYQSKMYLMLEEIEKNKGKITNEDAKEIAKIYDLSENSFPGILSKYIAWKQSLT